MPDLTPNKTEWADFFQRIDPHIEKILAWGKWCFSEPTRHDIAQKVRSEAVQKGFDQKPPEDLIPHLKRLTVSRCIDQARVQIRDGQRYVSVEPYSHMLETAEGEAVPGESPALMELERKEHRKMLTQKLENLGEPCAGLLGGFYFDGLKYKELADAFEVSINTIASRISRCMNRLRDDLKNSVEFREELLNRHRKS